MEKVGIKELRDKLLKISDSMLVKMVILPLIVFEILLILVYIFVFRDNISVVKDEYIKTAISNEDKLMELKVSYINSLLKSVEEVAYVMQDENQRFFKHLYNGRLIKPKDDKFAFAPNGVYYKVSKGEGTSLFYSADTNFTKKKFKKALYSAYMDNIFKIVVDNNPLIVAAYFNSWDNMNRYYPRLEKVYEQFGPTLKMEDFNFYYLADQKHNPNKKVVWTDSYWDPAGKGYMISCIVPIYYGNFLEGVSGLDVVIKDLAKEVSIKDNDSIRISFMISSKKFLVISDETKNMLIKNNIGVDSLLDKRVLSIGKRDYLVISKNIGIKDWKLVTLIDKKELFKNLNIIKTHTENIIILVLFIIFIFDIALYLLILKSIKNVIDRVVVPFIESILDDGLENKTEIVKELEQEREKIIELKEDNKRKEEILFQQAKQAQMGEMLSMIAHQWRQPLNAIAASIIDLSLTSQMDGATDKDIQRASDFIQNQVQKMSQIINSFIEFVKPEGNKKEFKVSEVVESALEMMKAQFRNRAIEIEWIKKSEVIKVFGYRTLLEQVIINICANARDAFEEQKDNNQKKIIVNCYKKGENFYIDIEDNAGGIPEDVQDRIFNPYFTTKGTKGTGLGLYMSKNIMKKEFCGDLEFNVIENGTIFSIIIGKECLVEENQNREG